ncbi:hypothetical protein [Nakamurella lactea]|uniref:hypothetical protein n=1 Tax=Nakamurella lactea TaxID=459515 RepID=UPI000413E837|nr:hypothetical protein [Nakamurella lactea]
MVSESPDATDPDGTVQLSDPAINAVAWLRGFEVDHGEAVAVVHYLGQRRARIVAIAGDGTFGDAVVESVEAAREVCRRAGIDLAQWDRDTAARVAVSPADRRKMAGTGR